METVETINYKGFIIKIEHDDSPFSPREDCNVGTIAAWHRNYNFNESGFSNVEDFQEYRKENKGIYLPLYMYDHGDIALSVDPFQCPWDSGQLGYIYILDSKIKKEFCNKRISKHARQRAIDCMTAEVKVYTDYVNGNVYGYVIEDKQGNDIDSCWGFIGDYDDYCLVEAKDIVDYHVEHTRKQRQARLKQLIRCNVPLEVRKQRLQEVV